jgi:putative ABC transport system permease protein
VNLVSIAWKSIRERGLASSLTAFSVALGVMLMVSVLVIYGILKSTFNQQSINYDVIVGPKGDPLQVVLNTVYHVSPPIKNMPYRYYLELKRDPRVNIVIPVAMGDVTQEGAFPIVGTTPEFFDVGYAPKRPFLVKAKGNGFSRPFDAYIGSRVALLNGWTLGTKLKLVHGGAETGHVHNEEFEVVGLLAPTGTPHDKTVYVNLEGFYQIQGHDKPLDEAINREREFFNEPKLTKDELKAEIERIEKKFGKHDHGHDGHDHRGHDHDHAHKLPDIQKEVTSVLLQCKTPIASRMLIADLKAGQQAQGVNPIEPMQKLMTDVLGPVQLLLIVLTGLIVVVSGIGIFVSIYNSMSARRREIAIMRALGAQRSTVLSIILAESVMLCVGGGLLGLVLGHGLVLATQPMVEIKTGLIIDPYSFSPYEGILFPVLFALGVLVGFLPGMTAYQTDVADSLNG